MNIEKRIKNIVQDIRDGKLSRDNDEIGADGFCDLSYELTGFNGTIDDDEQDVIEGVYNAFWQVVENSQKLQ